MWEMMIFYWSVWIITVGISPNLQPSNTSFAQLPKRFLGNVPSAADGRREALSRLYDKAAAVRDVIAPLEPIKERNVSLHVRDTTEIPL